ncbi:GroES-like protein [Jackrogersella minutella]|nr:GroES-like protein [Jackrogersella minutella]
MKALTLHPQDKSVQVEAIPPPIPAPTELLIRVGAIALNRVDWMYAARPVAACDRHRFRRHRRRQGGRRGHPPRARGAGCRVPAGSESTGPIQHAPRTSDRPGAFAEYVASTSRGLCVAQLVTPASNTSGQHIRLIGAARHDSLRRPPYAYDALVGYRDPEKARAAMGGRGWGWRLGTTIPASPQAREFAAEFYRFLSSGAARGETVLEPNPVRIMS